ncbi:MAG: DUF1800 family protein [Actinomycetota bacterium]
MNVSLTRADAAHLLRRAGWGGRSAEIDRVVADGVEATVARLLDPATAPVLVEPKAIPGFVPYEHTAAVGWFLRTCATSTAPAIERLTWFWHGHFATSVDKVDMVDLLVRQLATLRRLSLGRFDDLLLAMANDAAMNIWLDLGESVVGRPNENFARELLELFSMGAGNGYTQRDVVEAARAFTGHGLALDRTYHRPIGSRLFPTRHDYGTKTFLGQTGNLDGADIIATVVERPECHRFLAERFWLRYAGTAPRPEVIDTLAAAFAERLQVRDLLTALLTHPRFYDEEVRTGLVTQPFEVVVRVVRGFDLSMFDLTQVSYAELEQAEERGEEEPYRPGRLYPGEPIEWLATMGQMPMLPPNVAGWPHNGPWLDSNRSAGRLLVGTMIGHRLIEDDGDGSVGQALLDSGRAGARALTADLMERFGRVAWTEETEAAIGAALGDGGPAGVAAAVAVAFTSPEVTLA